MSIGENMFPPSPDAVVFGIAMFGCVSTIALIFLLWRQTTEKYYWLHQFEKGQRSVRYWSTRNRMYRDFLIDRKLWFDFEKYSNTPAIELLPPLPEPVPDNERKEPVAPPWARVVIPEDGTTVVIDKEIPEPVKA